MAFESTGVEGCGGICFRIAVSAFAFLKSLLDLTLH